MMSPRRTSRYGSNVLRDRSRRRVDQLIHQHVVAHQQRALHGSAGNDEGLHQRGGGEQQQDDGDGPLRDESAPHIPRHLRDSGSKGRLRTRLFLCLHSSHCIG